MPFIHEDTTELAPVYSASLLGIIRSGNIITLSEELLSLLTSNQIDYNDFEQVVDLTTLGIGDRVIVVECKGESIEAALGYVNEHSHCCTSVRVDFRAGQDIGTVELFKEGDLENYRLVFVDIPYGLTVIMPTRRLG